MTIRPQPHPSLPARGLYAITDPRFGNLVESVRAAIAGGASVVQYRDKSHDAERRLAEARALVALCHPLGVPLIVNDDVALAQASGAAGVHVGEDDAGIAEARATLGSGAIIGVSCYDSLARARTAVAAGADYIAFGAFFPTSTKIVTRYASPGLLREAAALGVPRVAIGGITPDNAAPLVAAGAEFLAVVSAVFGARDVTAAARRFAGLFAHGTTP